MMEQSFDLNLAKKKNTHLAIITLLVMLVCIIPIVFGVLNKSQDLYIFFGSIEGLAILFMFLVIADRIETLHRK